MRCQERRARAEYAELPKSADAAPRPDSATWRRTAKHRRAARGESRDEIVRQRADYDGAPRSFSGSLTPNFWVEMEALRTERTLESIDNGQRSLTYAGPTPLNLHQAAFDAADSGWYATGPGVVVAKSGTRAVTERKTFAVRLSER